MLCGGAGRRYDLIEAPERPPLTAAPVDTTAVFNGLMAGADKQGGEGALAVAGPPPLRVNIPEVQIA